MGKKQPPAGQFTFDFVPPASKDEALIRAQRDVPNDSDGAIAMMAEQLDGYHAAIVGRDAARAVQVLSKVHAIRARLGDMHRGRFDCLASCYDWLDTLPSLGTPMGTAPKYGRAGDFAIDFEHLHMKCRVRVKVDGLIGDSWSPDYLPHTGIKLHCIDWDKPFLSETGFRAMYGRMGNALGVEDPAEFVRAEIIGEFITNAYQEPGTGRKLKKPRWHWHMVGEKGTFSHYGEEFCFKPQFWRELMRGEYVEDPAWQPGGYLCELVGLEQVMTWRAAFTAHNEAESKRRDDVEARWRKTIPGRRASVCDRWRALGNYERAGQLAPRGAGDTASAAQIKKWEKEVAAAEAEAAKQAAAAGGDGEAPEEDEAAAARMPAAA